jgi:hypothetical protein
MMNDVIVAMEADRSAYTGQPGSSKDLFAVTVDGEFWKVMGPRNALGLKPGQSREMVRMDDGSLATPEHVAYEAARAAIYEAATK